MSLANPAPRPIAVLSGMGVPPRLWRTVYFRAFAQAGLEPVLIDYAADWFAPGERPSVRQIADACLSRLEPLLPRRPLLLGFSLGALIAQEIAASAGDRLHGLVLISPFAEQIALQRTAFGVEAGIRARAQADDRAMLALLDIIQLSSRAELFDDAVFPARYLARRDAGHDPWEDAMFNAVQGYDHRLDGLGAIACPALVLAFAEDMMVPPSCSRRVAAAIPGARFAEIANAGHIGVLTHAQQVLAAALAFVTPSPAADTPTSGTSPTPASSASSPPPAPAAA
jgi:pimeloyl-ACP methyl ester carboxylesterase